MARRQCSEDAIVQMLDECDLSDLEDVLGESSVEINKHKIFYANNAWITELLFQKPKKHNLNNLPHQRVEKLQQKNHGALRGPQLGKQR